MSLFPASYSKLSTYERCPAQVKYRYIDMRSTPKSPQMQRGTDLHASAENFLRGLKTTIRKELVPLVGTLRKVKQAQPFVEHKIALTYDLEKRCEWGDKKAWFRMVLDSAYLDNGTAHVQEWKSGKVYEDHEDQRNLYAVGSILEWGADGAEVTTHYIDQHNEVKLVLSAKAAKLTAWRFAERITAMSRDKHFHPRPGHYCRWCPFSRYGGGPCKVG